MNTKKLLSLVLVLVLALSLSVVSLAADEPAYEEWTSTDSLPTSGAYKLMENVNVTTEFSNAPTIKGSLVLDLNGKTVTITGGSFNAITAVSYTHLLYQNHGRSPRVRRFQRCVRKHFKSGGHGF